MKTIDMKETLQMHLEEDGKLVKINIITFHAFWNILIGVQTFSITIMMTYILAYNHRSSGLILLMFLCDIFYFLDFIGNLIYLKNWKTLRFLPYPPKDWKLLIVDFVSLIPLGYGYETYFFQQKKSGLIFRLLVQNRCLRIYRIFVLFNFFDLTIRNPYHYLGLLVIKFVVASVMISHIMSCIWFNLPQLTPCTIGHYRCLVWRETSIYRVLIHHWNGETVTFHSPLEKVLVIVTIICGIYLIYGDLIPEVLLVFLRISRIRGRFYQKYQKLERFLHNIGVDQSVNEKVHRYFDRFWSSDTTGEEMKNLMTEVPLALKKDIYTDIYWDAFRHSDLFRDVSRCCKRSMSLVMTTEYCQEGEIIWSKSSFKNKMVYLVEGLMELMADENETSPIMSFSTGTVLGEMSLFSILKSHATVKCRTLCQLHVLSLRDVYPILLNYPKDRNIIFQKLNRRLAIAKITQWRRRRLTVDRMMELDFPSSLSVVTNANEDRVKWVKKQWRAIWEMHERDMLVIRAQEGGLKIPAWRRQHQIQTALDTVSNYMDLLVLSDIFEEKKDVICLKTSFPWAIDPDVEFLRLWGVIVVIAAITSGSIYPFCSGWLDSMPKLVYTVSIACTIIFEIDLALLLMIAVKTRHRIITSFSSILINRLKKPTFYLDVLAALPFHLINYLGVYQVRIGYLLLPCILKAHVLFRRRNLRGHTVFSCIVKNVFFLALLTYWFAAVIQHMSFHCFPICGFFTWNINFIQFIDEFTRNNLMSVFLAMSTSLRLAENFSTKNMFFTITITFCSFFFLLWMCWFLGDFYTVYSINISNQQQFMIIFDRIMQYLEGVHMTSVVQKRIVRMIRFQWIFNKADDLLTKTSAIALAPRTLRREIYFNSISKTLRRCPVFQYEVSTFIYDTIERSDVIAVPSGTVLVNYGFRCNRIHLLHKGFCQTNSFLRKDISRGIAAPILVKPGEIFPTLASFAYVPPPISVVTLTDCVIVVFQVEEVLRAMNIHKIFRDLSSSLLSSDLLERLSDHTSAVTPKNIRYNAPVDKAKEYDLPFRFLGLFGTVLKRVLFHKNIFFDKDQQQKPLYKAITAIYIFYIMTTMFLWPLTFGLLIYQARYITPALIVCNLFILVYIYLQFHTPYFDRRGLLITHPLYTIRHYITTNFLLDVVMHLPIYSISHLFRAVDSEPLVLVTIIQKLLFLVPIKGYFSAINKQSIKTPLNRNFYAVLIFAAILNAVANYEMFASMILTRDATGRIVGFVPNEQVRMSSCLSRDNDDVIKMFVSITCWLFAQLTSNNTICQSFLWREKIYALSCSFVGTVIVWLFYGWLSAHSAISDAQTTLYQERMNSFLNFLVSSKTKDKIVVKTIGYFEHLWSKSQGQNLREICERLPYHLHEDLAYPLYKPTLHRVAFFGNIDESFYRMLSTLLDLVYFNRGSIILSRGQIQSDIYFVHRGKCFVFDWFLTLDLGSVIGDISHTGRVVNKVFALTHVELLRIDSDKFFKLINNYYEVERQFFMKAVTSENFIKSPYVERSQQPRPVDSRDVLNAFDLQTKDFGFEDQSYFEDPENVVTKREIEGKQTSRRRHLTLTIYPGTFPMFLYNAINFTVAFLTMTISPNIIFFGGLTWPAFLFTAVLDGVWAVGVFATFRVGIEDKVKGDVITSGKFIARTYLLAWDGFFLRLISCLPFELIPILLSHRLEDVDQTLVAFLRCLRFFRVYYLVKYLLEEVNKLKVSGITRYMAIISFYVLYIHFMVFLFFIIVSKKEIVSPMTPLKLDNEQYEAILLVYHFVVNTATSTNMCFLHPQSMAEMIYFNVFSFLSIYIKAFIIKYMLTIKYVQNLARGKHKNQITLLESYLKKSDLSPSILKEVLDYKHNLLIVARSENNPTFLLMAPTFLRIAIMSDLYLFRLKKSPIFRDINSSFLKLLVSRLKRQIFFPGQKIVEKGDVDNTMYFIHRGEVYVVDQTDDEAYIEFVVDRMFAGEEFGQAQGLTLAKPHPNTYRARTIVEVLALHSADWTDLKKDHPDVYMEIIETLKKLTA